MKIIIVFLFLNGFYFGQILPKIIVKTGISYSGQQINPSPFIEGQIYGFVFGFEPTFVSFGKNKMFELNTDLLFVQKGGINTSPIYNYNQFGTVQGTGSESYRVRLSYFSFSPLIKSRLWKGLFIKSGPRIDLLLNASVKDRFSSDNRTKKDFNALNYGVTYGLGYTFGKKQIQFITELIGQHDFNNSANYLGAKYKNYSFILNFGVQFKLQQSK